MFIQLYGGQLLFDYTGGKLIVYISLIYKNTLIRISSLIRSLLKVIICKTVFFSKNFISDSLILSEQSLFIELKITVIVSLVRMACKIIVWLGTLKYTLFPQGSKFNLFTFKLSKLLKSNISFRTK